MLLHRGCNAPRLSSSIAAFEIGRSIPLALTVSVFGALAVGCFAEGRLAGIISSIGKIAGGDRYTSLPKLLGDGAIRNFNDAAGKIRAALMEADTLAVDQSRRETEARLHHAGRHFFTGNFRHAVDDVVNAFT